MTFPTLNGRVEVDKSELLNGVNKLEISPTSGRVEVRWWTVGLCSLIPNGTNQVTKPFHGKFCRTRNLQIKSLVTAEFVVTTYSIHQENLAWTGTRQNIRSLTGGVLISKKVYDYFMFSLHVDSVDLERKTLSHFICASQHSTITI